MKRSDLRELHYISPIENVPSILNRGILCHKIARKFQHKSVALQDVQERRERKKVPGGLLLHEYVNLYFCARNPMLYRLSDQHLELCVFQVSTDVLDLPGVVITDGNAAGDYTAFWPSPSGLEKIDHELVFAESWMDSNQIRYWQKKSAKCAEVLVPAEVPLRHILGIYVSCKESLGTLRLNGSILPVSINPHIFFR